MAYEEKGLGFRGQGLGFRKSPACVLQFARGLKSSLSIYDVWLTQNSRQTAKIFSGRIPETIQSQSSILTMKSGWLIHVNYHRV